MAILVPPKSRPSTTGESATDNLSRGGALVPGGACRAAPLHQGGACLAARPLTRAKPSCPILLGQYPNYQVATRPRYNRLATAHRRGPLGPGAHASGCRRMTL